MRATMNVVENSRYLITQTNRRYGTERTFPATITAVEDCGSFFYVRFVPDDCLISRWGYAKVFKNDADNHNRAVRTTVVAI